MASTFGFTLQDWQRCAQQDAQQIPALLAAHLDALDNQIMPAVPRFAGPAAGAG